MARFGIACALTCHPRALAFCYRLAAHQIHKSCHILREMLAKDFRSTKGTRACSSEDLQYCSCQTWITSMGAGSWCPPMETTPPPSFQFFSLQNEGRMARLGRP
jgi:hypothetical protein